MAAQEPEHFRVTYNDVHNLIRASAAKIAEFKPDMLIAIGARAPFSPLRRYVIYSTVCPLTCRWRASIPFLFLLAVT